MKSSLIRALCAMIMGALLIEYREQTVTWLTVVLGVLFLISGVVSCIAYIASRRRKDEPQLFDSEGRQISATRPPFPIVGIGSVLLGIILTAIPNTFVAWLMYILAAVLVLGALGQFVALTSASRYAHVGFYYWVLPTIILIVAMVAIVKPSVVASAPLLLIGWCMVVYGMTELVNAIKIYKVRKAWEKTAKEVPTSNAVDTTNIIDITEETEP